MADRTVQCRLLAGKTRVAPKCKISIPRMELMGALLAVRLAWKIRDSLQVELEAVRYFTDSTAVLGMILRESATYQEFVGTWVSEIKTKSDPEKEWFWIPGEQNIADMGTRPTRVPRDMGPGTPYQEGLPWMKEPPEVWPTKETFMPPPPEECKKDMLAMVKAVRGDEIGPRRPRCNLGMEKEPEAASVWEGDPAGSGEPKEDEPLPTGRKRRRMPNKSDKQGATGREVRGELQPATKRRPGRPRKKPQADPDKDTVKEDVKGKVTQDPGGQQQALRRGRSRDLAPKGQQDSGRSC
jgi:hypothetical protein